MSQYGHYREPEYRSSNYQSCNCRARVPKARSKIMGVCAGIAHQFGWDVTFVRVVAVIALFTLTVPTFLAYIIAGVLFY